MNEKILSDLEVIRDSLDYLSELWLSLDYTIFFLKRTLQEEANDY